MDKINMNTLKDEELLAINGGDFDPMRVFYYVGYGIGYVFYWLGKGAYYTNPLPSDIINHKS
ncbi:hypothetical protein [Thermoanaerobacter uzonensis]|uniref:hypothetical protein n=1 Tax=Thermoanaerobacter uzonensis TaxID=447593 RepID=UPI003D767370